MPASQPPLPEPPELPGSSLFPAEVMEALTDEERKFGLYTGERCPKQKREAIIQLVAEGRAIDSIRRLLGVHRETVLNVANQFAAEIADYERRMAAKLRRCKWALADRIEREVDQIPRQALGLTFKIVSDQEATDSGRAIARVDHVHRIDLFTDFPDFVRELEARPVIDEKKAGEILLAGEKNLLMAAPAADPGADLEPTGTVPASGGQSDWKSDVSSLPTQASQPNLPALLPDLGVKSGVIDDLAADRRGGDQEAAAPGKPTKDNGSEKFSGNGL
jgi:hypothetical protein